MMDATGMGRLSPLEFLGLYACCIAFVKLLPLWSIGLVKVLSNPRKCVRAFVTHASMPTTRQGRHLALSLHEARHEHRRCSCTGFVLLLHLILNTYCCCHWYSKPKARHESRDRACMCSARRYLLQTSFYAQGVIFGGVLFIAIDSVARGVRDRGRTGA
jgi:hypothetical protein